jgi:hypothetical protein
MTVPGRPGPRSAALQGGIFLSPYPRRVRFQPRLARPTHKNIPRGSILERRQSFPNLAFAFAVCRCRRPRLCRRRTSAGHGQAFALLANAWSPILDTYQLRTNHNLSRNPTLSGMEHLDHLYGRIIER